MWKKIFVDCSLKVPFEECYRAVMYKVISDIQYEKLYTFFKKKFGMLIYHMPNFPV